MARRLQVLVTAILGAVAAAGQGASAADISAAERLVFMENHLGGVKPPAELRYSFEETGPRPAAEGDQLRLALTARSDGGCCAVTAEERGGTAFAALPPIDQASANPVILYFLERDVRQMQALTGGGSNYFRRLIRLSLADHAQVRDTSIRYGGQELPAREVRVAPYVDDPRRGQYAALADKAYVFVLAEGVPGRVYQIRTVVSAPAPGSPAAPEAVLTLAEQSAPAVDSPSVQERTP